MCFHVYVWFGYAVVNQWCLGANCFFLFFVLPYIAPPCTFIETQDRDNKISSYEKNGYMDVLGLAFFFCVLYFKVHSS